MNLFRNRPASSIPNHPIIPPRHPPHLPRRRCNKNLIRRQAGHNLDTLGLQGKTLDKLDANLADALLGFSERVNFRKYYGITPDGEKALAEARQKIRELIEEMLEEVEEDQRHGRADRRLEAAARR